MIDQQMVMRARQWFGSSTNILFGAAVLLIIGMLLEAIWCNDNFQRIGAVLIVYSIALLSLNKAATPTEIKMDRYLDFSREICQLTNDGKQERIRRNFAGDKTAEAEFKNYLLNPDQLENDKNNLASARASIVDLEAAVLIIGTLVWGYGDLIINFSKCC